PEGADVKDWSADRFWTEFERRLPRDLADKLETGPALEMSITPLHSYVCTTMQCGRMYLVGDAVHVVPPTGAKGLNLAVADAKQLADALHDHYAGRGDAGLAGYTQTALLRIWKAVRFSWWMTNLSHRISDNPFDRQIQLAEYEFTRSSIPAQTAIAANFCGLA
ncbi:MAG TPA: FAD-dependent monooxygenase, partial [Nevskiaceae bacterium]